MDGAGELTRLHAAARQIAGPIDHESARRAPGLPAIGGVLEGAQALLKGRVSHKKTLETQWLAGIFS